ncbi:MAG: hypothetical protein RIC55_35160 [Pirellulaceae bacterium]
MDDANPNPYETPQGIDEPPDALPERRLDVAQQVRAAGSLSLDEWHESEWLVGQRFRGVVYASRPKSQFVQYSATAFLAYLVILGVVVWRGLANPTLFGFLGAIGAIIVGTIIIYLTARLRLNNQWKHGKGPFQTVEYLFDQDTLTIRAGEHCSELLWGEFDFHRRNNKVMLLHVRGAISSLIVSRGMFASPEKWQEVCQGVDGMFAAGES